MVGNRQRDYCPAPIPGLNVHFSSAHQLQPLTDVGQSRMRFGISLKIKSGYRSFFSVSANSMFMILF